MLRVEMVGTVAKEGLSEKVTLKWKADGSEDAG